MPSSSILCAFCDLTSLLHESTLHSSLLGGLGGLGSLLLGGLGRLGVLGLSLDDLLDDLLLLDQESTNDSVTDAVSAAGTTIGTVDGLLAAGDASVLGRTESRDLSFIGTKTSFISHGQIRALTKKQQRVASRWFVGMVN